MEKLSIVLKRIRESKDMTIIQLAEKAGVGKGTVGDIETGRSKGSIKTINKLAKAMCLNQKERNLLDSAFLGREVVGSNDDVVENMSKKERIQYEDFMAEATLFFNDEKISDEDKEKLFKSLQEVFFRAKFLNKRKK